MKHRHEPLFLEGKVRFGLAIAWAVLVFLSGLTVVYYIAGRFLFWHGLENWLFVMNLAIFVLAVGMTVTERAYINATRIPDGTIFVHRNEEGVTVYSLVLTSPSIEAGLSKRTELLFEIDRTPFEAQVAEEESHENHGL